MSQSNTNTNNEQIRNQISGRGGRRQGPSSRGCGDCRNNCGNNSITNKYSFKGKMKDGPISKLLITETGHRLTQYKKVIDTLPILCADKNYRGLDDIIWNRIDLVEANSTPPYPEANRWSTTHHVEVRIINPWNIPQADGSRPQSITMARQTDVFDANLQKELPSEFEWNSKIKSQ